MHAGITERTAIADAAVAEEPLGDLDLITRSDVLRSYPKDVAECVQQRAQAAVSAAQKYQRRKDRNAAIGALVGTVSVSVVQALITGPRHLLPLGTWGAALLPLVFLLLWLIWELADEDLEDQMSRLVLPEQAREAVTSRDLPSFRQLEQVGLDVMADERNHAVLKRVFVARMAKIAVTLLAFGVVLFFWVSAGWWPTFATLVAAVVCGVVGWQVGSRVGRPIMEMDPRDAMIGVFLKVAAQALPQSVEEHWRHQTTDWRKDTFNRALFAESLERAGRDVSRLVPKLAPWSGGLRRLMRDRAERIAAGFHAHALAVTLGGCDRDERTVESLVAGVVAACTDDWEALAQADPQPLRRHVMLAWIRRGAVVGVLVGASLVVLLVMPESTTRQQIVFTLWAAALAALASPEDALGRVADRVEALGKGSGS